MTAKRADEGIITRQIKQRRRNQEWYEFLMEKRNALMLRLKSSGVVDSHGGRDGLDRDDEFAFLDFADGGQIGSDAGQWSEPGREIGAPTDSRNRNIPSPTASPPAHTTPEQRDDPYGHTPALVSSARVQPMEPSGGIGGADAVFPSMHIRGPGGATFAIPSSVRASSPVPQPLERRAQQAIPPAQPSPSVEPAGLWPPGGTGGRVEVDLQRPHGENATGVDSESSSPAQYMRGGGGKRQPPEGATEHGEEPGAGDLTEPPSSNLYDTYDWAAGYDYLDTTPPRKKVT
jgi:hypothetical protein